MAEFGQKHLRAFHEVYVCLAMVVVRSLCALVGLGPQGCSLLGLGGGTTGMETGVVPAASSRHPPKKWLVARHTLLQLCFPSRRIFVLGIGFFTLCFLMTSLGGQFSAKRLGDSPFTIRTEGKSAPCPSCPTRCLVTPVHVVQPS